MSVRLFHRGSRVVLVLGRDESDISQHRWLAVHYSTHPWDQIFAKAIAILDLTAAPGLDLHWTVQRYWTKIDVRLTQGSLRKRQLIATALLKAARYQVL
jgi:hypothetical protein